MLHEELQELLDAQKEGIDLRKLKPGTKIIVGTVNSTYNMAIINQKEVWLQGGKKLPKKTKGFLVGSTWGGSMLKIAWIGYDMHMEFHFNDKILTSSRVQKAKVIGEDWEYDLFLT